MFETAAYIIVALALGWMIQYAFAYYQLRRFYRRVSELRKDGIVSIGLAGSAWRGRLYAVLVVDKEHMIRHAEQLSGWTIMAQLKPMEGLTGRPMSDLLDDSVELPVSPKQLLALRNAISYIEAMERRKREKEQENEDEQLPPSETAPEHS